MSTFDPTFFTEHRNEIYSRNYISFLETLIEKH